MSTVWLGSSVVRVLARYARGRVFESWSGHVLFLPCDNIIGSHSTLRVSCDPMISAHPLDVILSARSSYCCYNVYVSLFFFFCFFFIYIIEEINVDKLIKYAAFETPTNHSHAKLRSAPKVHKRSFWFSIRGVKNVHLL